MQEELISVIVPVYKVEKYIRKCVESIINQTYKNLEIILVDDGSPDACGDICEEYAKSDKRIIVLHQNNQGVSVARNNGLKRCNGKYVTFVDSDDYIADRYCDSLYNLLVKYNSDISICAEEYVRVDCLDNLIKMPRPFKSFNGEIEMNKVEALECVLNQEHFDFSPWGKLYRREILNDIEFPQNYLYEDQGTIYKFFINSNKISFTSKRLYYYLQREGSILHTITDSKRFWNGVKMLEQQHADVIKDYPQLLKAANSRLISMYFHSFSGACITHDIKLKEYCWDKIKSLRFSVLRDSNARKKARLASLLSFFGMSVMEFVMTHK